MENQQIPQLANWKPIKLLVNLDHPPLPVLPMKIIISVERINWISPLYLVYVMGKTIKQPMKFKENSYPQKTHIQFMKIFFLVFILYELPLEKPLLLA